MLPSVLALCAFSCAATLVVARWCRSRQFGPAAVLASGVAMVVVSAAGFVVS